MKRTSDNISGVKVSIIVPVYNMEKYLKRCLVSITEQSYIDLEIMLVNDGSTDSSKDIIDNFAAKDKRIVAIHKENGGIGSAYKVAFEVMTGDYVLFVDSDDWLELDAVERLMAILHKENFDIISFGRVTVDEKNTLIKSHIVTDRVLYGSKNILLFHLSKIQDPSLASRIFRVTLFRELNIFQQNIGIDEQLIIQLYARAVNQKYITDYLYNTLFRPQSISRLSIGQNKIDQTLNVFTFLFELAQNYSSSIKFFLYNKILRYSMNTWRSVEQNNNIDITGIQNLVKVVLSNYPYYLLFVYKQGTLTLIRSYAFIFHLQIDRFKINK